MLANNLTGDSKDEQEQCQGKMNIREGEFSRAVLDGQLTATVLRMWRKFRFAAMFEKRGFCFWAKEARDVKSIMMSPTATSWPPNLVDDLGRTDVTE